MIHGPRQQNQGEDFEMLIHSTEACAEGRVENISVDPFGEERGLLERTPTQGHWHGWKGHDFPLDARFYR